MTEQEWLTATDPLAMLEVVRPRATRRQLRFYLIGGCRGIASSFFHRVSLEVVEKAEQFADGSMDVDLPYAVWKAESVAFGYEFENDRIRRFLRERREILGRLIEMGVLPGGSRPGERWRIEDGTRERLLAAASLAEFCGSYCLGEDNWGWRHIARVNWPERWLFDCIFGNPFQPPDEFASRWQTTTVLNLAQAVYDTRQLPSGRFDTQRLAVLADALEDAGCDNTDLLGHLRDSSDHVRGCWAVDLILGKE